MMMVVMLMVMNRLNGKLIRQTFPCSSIHMERRCGRLKKNKTKDNFPHFGFASSLGDVSDGGRHPPYSSTCGWTFGFNEVKYNKKSRPPDWLSPAAIFSRRGLQSKHHKTGSSSNDNNPVALLFSFRSILLVSFFLLIIIIFIISKEEEEDGEL